MRRTIRYASAIGTLAVFAAVSAACMVHEAPEPLLTGPSEFGNALTMVAVPDLLTRDGRSQSMIIVTATDPSGAPLTSQQLRLDMIVNGVYTDFGTLSTKTLFTGTDGKATAFYTAPPALAAGITNFVRIVVSPVGVNQQNTGSSPFGQFTSVDIRLVSPTTNTPGAPVAFFTYSPGTGITPSTLVVFNASASYPVAGSRIVNYAWDWGDGTVDNTNTGASEDHDWAGGGSYAVTLTVTDDLGQRGSTTQIITVG